MSSYIVYVLILLLSDVRSDEFSQSTWRDMKNDKIQVNEYCKTRNCIVKCCPDGHFIAPTATGMKCVIPKLQAVVNLINYSKIDVYKWSKSSNEVTNTKKNLISEFDFVQNEILSDSNKTVTFSMCDIQILEDGSLKSKSPCIDISKLEYCIDFYYNGKKNTSSGLVPDVVFAYRAIIRNDPDARSKHNFVAPGMLISSFFMMLVLLVYGVLPRLRNIVGMVLMAYLLTLIVAYIMKAVQLILLTAASINPENCRVLSPAVYYFIIASFFWLNVMSFDLWWTIRGTRKSRDIHRQGEVIKFLWYGLYAWGTPALMTLGAVAVDRFHLYKENRSKPPFDSCFADKTPTALYMHVPIGIMTAANCVLFLLTAYNVWLVKRAVSNNKDNRNTKSSENRFAIYMKLSVLMGVSWILELVPDMSLIPHIMVNFYNVFIGVAIFILFVCKKSIIIMLSKRFCIRNRFVDKLQASQSSKSENTRSSSWKKSRYSQSQKKEGEDTELTRYSTDTP